MAFKDRFYEAVAEWLRGEGYLCDHVYLVEPYVSEATGTEYVEIHFQFNDEDGFNATSLTWGGTLWEFIETLG